jgi:hypothetical protein
VPNFKFVPSPAHDLAPAISVVEGEVVVVGPGAVAFSMTRAAAQETYRRLGQALKDSEGAPLTTSS